uniref:NADH-ubiquinone oxidoreductase chain 2 n=1 Tax=Spinolyprops cribricollis TaxID=2984372 RepID=A0A978D4U0_9CUCU|nr:NADH dehydrogenase subunit 2 [Spinolyprops cribricollis]UYB79056.1 NADH dehydrogenase subunit 2 [Spinolyprops cribricollis]
MKIYSFMFMNMVILGTMVTTTAYSWMAMWLGLEINLMSIIPILASTKTPKSAEASIKYFISQAIASLILLMSMISLNLFDQLNFWISNPTMWIMNSALLLKMGAAPLHFWFPEVLSGLSWMNCFTVMTWQKIAPMSILMNSFIDKTLITMSIILSALISVILIFNQSNMRKIMAYSSINHLSWMLTSMFYSSNLWLIYFSIYSIINLMLTIMFKLNSINSVNQIFFLKSSLNKIFSSISMLTLAGMPPTLGFMPKWFIIQFLTMNKYFMLPLILIISTIITLSIYFSLAISAFTLSINQMKLKMNFSMNTKITLIFSFGLILSTLAFNLI